MLILVKLLHTTVWALLVGCIIALPIAALRHRFDVVPSSEILEMWSSAAGA